MTARRGVELPPYTRFVAPTAGAWLRLFVNLLLRVLVKWTLGLGIDVPRLRARQLALDRRARPLDGVTRTATACDGVAAEWLTPAAGEASRVLLYLHGGAFVARSLATPAAMVVTWCKNLGARALMAA